MRTAHSVVRGLDSKIKCNLDGFSRLFNKEKHMHSWASSLRNTACVIVIHKQKFQKFKVLSSEMDPAEIRLIR
jgi:hypothetical protein